MVNFHTHAFLSEKKTNKKNNKKIEFISTF